MEEDAHRVESEQKDEADPISEDEGSDSQCSCLFYYCHECFPERFPDWALAENEQDKKAEKEEPEKAPASNELDNDELDNEGFEPDDVESKASTEEDEVDVDLSEGPVQEKEPVQEEQAAPCSVCLLHGPGARPEAGPSAYQRKLYAPETLKTIAKIQRL